MVMELDDRAATEVDEHGVPLYPPGVVVAAGDYLPLDRPHAEPICLKAPGALPATLDGHQVRYIRLRPFEGPSRIAGSERSGPSQRSHGEPLDVERRRGRTAE